MEQMILPSDVIEFTWLVMDDFMEANGLAPSAKKGIRSPKLEGPQEIWNFPSP